MNKIGICELNLTKLRPKFPQLDFQLLLFFHNIIQLSFQVGHLQFFVFQLPRNCITSFPQVFILRYQFLWMAVYAFVVSFWNLLFWTGNALFTTNVFINLRFAFGVFCELRFIDASFLPFSSCHSHIEVLTFQALRYSPLYRHHREDLQCFLVVLWTCVPNKLLASSN